MPNANLRSSIGNSRLSQSSSTAHQLNYAPAKLTATTFTAYHVLVWTVRPLCVTGHESEWNPLHRHELARIRLRFLRPSQGCNRHRISTGIDRRISTVSAGDRAGKMAASSRPTSPANLGQLDSPTPPQCQSQPPSWQVKSLAIVPRNTATISPLLAAVSASAFGPAKQGRRHHLPALQRSTQRQTISSGSPGQTTRDEKAEQPGQVAAIDRANRRSNRKRSDTK